MELFETSIGHTVNWPFFTLFMVFVGVNILYGMLCCSIKFMRKWPFKIVGWALALGMLYILILLSYKAHGNIQDFDSYLKIYQNYNSYKDEMYGRFQEWFKARGVEFDLYRQIYYAITFVILWVAVTIIRANKNIVFGCFAIFPWMFFGRQMRIAMAMSLICLAAALLTMKSWRKIIGIVCFFPLIYLAYSFHGATIFFAVLIIMGFSFKNRNYIGYIAFVAGTIFIVAYFFGFNLFVKIIESFPKELTDRLKEYATIVPDHVQTKELLGIETAYLAAMVFARLAVTKKQADKDPTTAKEYHKVTSLFDSGIAMFCIVLSVTVSLFCIRFIRYFTIIIYAAIAVSMKNAKFKAFNPFVIASIAFLLLGTYLNFSFLDSYETGGFDLAFYTFFVF